MNQIEKFQENGYTVINQVYSNEEVDKILFAIGQLNSNKDTFRKSADLFAIRQFLKELPSSIDIIFNNTLSTILRGLLGNKYFVVKSIYFDKPSSSNWFVSYHQDLTISVDKKGNQPGFNNWTVKQNQFSVQPPVDILENIVTVRIHLDDTDENNGALKVIAKSHLKGVSRPETIDRQSETESSCCVLKGGIMLMKPLLLHSSGRTTNDRQRRVIHIELSNRELPDGLNWAERIVLN
jgi:ectoine hydroxylase-related dioxygenase (phytanoyl-CoA dioxygenase family)